MLIPTSSIKNWQDLQNQVASLFREMGYVAHTPYEVKLVRGDKEVDVYIEDPRQSVSHRILVECKHWATPVPQDTVHSMRTIMADSGANTGIIVSSAGFQSGAGDAAANSNIQLLTWEGLQRAYGHEWYLRQMEKLNPLRQRLLYEDGRFLNQHEAILTTMNLMPYETIGALPELYDILAEGRSLTLAMIATPTAFDMPGPFHISVNDGYPGAVTDKWGLPSVEVPTVRAWFSWMQQSMQGAVDRIEKLNKSVNEAFHALPDKDIDQAMERAMSEIREETPMRVLKQYVGDEEYARLRKLLDEKKR